MMEEGLLVKKETKKKEKERMRTRRRRGGGLTKDGSENLIIRSYVHDDGMSRKVNISLSLSFSSHTKTRGDSSLSFLLDDDDKRKGK